jgi:phosphoribosylglycinamide formyltransferase
LVKHKYHASGETDQAVRQAAREKYDADLADLVLADEPDIVICAGWMHVLSPKFLDPLAAKKVPVINLHPALPGKYDGIDAIKRAYDDYHKGKLEHDRTGIMIHYVISEVDRGQPIVVREVECRTPETLEELKARMHAEEHTLILEGTAMAIHNLWAERSRSGQLLVSLLKSSLQAFQFHYFNKYFEVIIILQHITETEEPANLYSKILAL